MGSNPTAVIAGLTPVGCNPTLVRSRLTEVGSNPTVVIARLTPVGCNPTSVRSRLTGVGSNPTVVIAGLTPVVMQPDAGQEPADWSRVESDRGHCEADSGRLQLDGGSARRFFLAARHPGSRLTMASPCKPSSPCPSRPGSR